MYMGM